MELHVGMILTNNCCGGIIEKLDERVHVRWSSGSFGSRSKSAFLDELQSGSIEIVLPTPADLAHWLDTAPTAGSDDMARRLEAMGWLHPDTLALTIKGHDALRKDGPNGYGTEALSGYALYKKTLDQASASIIHMFVDRAHHADPFADRMADLLGLKRYAGEQDDLLRARILRALNMRHDLSASGKDLDRLAAFYGLNRLAGETDEWLRDRVNMRAQSRSSVTCDISGLRPLADALHAVFSLSPRERFRRSVDAAVARLKGQPFAHAIAAALYAWGEYRGCMTMHAENALFNSRTPDRVNSVIAGLTVWEQARPSVQRRLTRSEKDKCWDAAAAIVDLPWSVAAAYERARGDR